MRLRIGLVGTGEAGIAIARGLNEEHGVALAAYDARGDDPVVRERAAGAGIRLVPDLAALAAESEVVICLTSAKVALQVASDIAPYLGVGHIYADWNSASPEVKQQAAEVVGASAARFVDGAVMGAVPPSRHRVPVLLSGDGALDLERALDGLDMQLEVLGSEPGQASAVKMLRSLLVKGLEALLLECAAGAQAFGVTERVLDSMDGALPAEDWAGLAAYLLERTTRHGERRAEELRQVARTLVSVGLEPLMADAGAKRLQWYVDLGVADPDAVRDFSYYKALDAVEKARKARA